MPEGGDQIKSDEQEQIYQVDFISAHLNLIRFPLIVSKGL